MRRTIQKGSIVKVLNPQLVHTDALDIAKELGVDESRWNKKKVLKDDIGEVIDLKEGFVLVDFEGDTQVLLDIDAIEITHKPENTAVLLKFQKSGQVEEFPNEEDAKEYIEKLVKEGKIRMDEKIQYYKIVQVKTIGMKLNISLG